MNKTLEQLAWIQHEIWSHWMDFMLNECTELEDGSCVIPAEKRKRWERQLMTPYHDLSEAEKESDREQARKVMEVLGL